MFDVPLQTHRYFLEHLTGTRQLKITLIKRFLSFISQIENSPKLLPNILLQMLYEPVYPENVWRIPLVKELIDAKLGEASIDIFANSEINDILEDFCTS